jgi:hypothetical protein
MDKKFYLGPKIGTLFNKKLITISELLQEAILQKKKFDRGQEKNKCDGFITAELTH